MDSPCLGGGIRGHVSSVESELGALLLLVQVVLIRTGVSSVALSLVHRIAIHIIPHLKDSTAFTQPLNVL